MTMACGGGRRSLPGSRPRPRRDRASGDATSDGQAVSAFLRVVRRFGAAASAASARRLRSPAASAAVSAVAGVRRLGPASSFRFGAAVGVASSAFRRNLPSGAAPCASGRRLRRPRCRRRRMRRRSVRRRLPPRRLGASARLLGAGAGSAGGVDGRPSPARSRWPRGGAAGGGAFGDWASCARSIASSSSGTSLHGSLERGRRPLDRVDRNGPAEAADPGDPVPGHSVGRAAAAGGLPGADIGIAVDSATAAPSVALAVDGGVVAGPAAARAAATPPWPPRVHRRRDRPGRGAARRSGIRGSPARRSPRRRQPAGSSVGFELGTPSCESQTDPNGFVRGGRGAAAISTSSSSPRRSSPSTGRAGLAASAAPAAGSKPGSSSRPRPRPRPRPPRAVDAGGDRRHRRPHRRASSSGLAGSVSSSLGSPTGPETGATFDSFSPGRPSAPRRAAARRRACRWSPHVRRARRPARPRPAVRDRVRDRRVRDRPRCPRSACPAPRSSRGPRRRRRPVGPTATNPSRRARAG